MGVTSDGVTARDPWTDPDPQPGDFDAVLRALEAPGLEHCPGKPDAKLVIVSEADLQAMLRPGRSTRFA